MKCRYNWHGLRPEGHVECSGDATHRVEGYFLKPDMKDRNLYLCDAHAAEYRELHPFAASQPKPMRPKAK